MQITPLRDKIAHTRARRRKSILGNTEELESWLIMVPKKTKQFLYLYGDAAEGSADDPRDSQRAVVLQGVGAVGADELCVVHFGERGSHELQSLLGTQSPGGFLF